MKDKAKIAAEIQEETGEKRIRSSQSVRDTEKAGGGGGEI